MAMINEMRAISKWEQANKKPHPNRANYPGLPPFKES